MKKPRKRAPKKIRKVQLAVFDMTKLYGGKDVLEAREVVMARRQSTVGIFTHISGMIRELAVAERKLEKIADVLDSDDVPSEQSTGAARVFAPQL